MYIWACVVILILVIVFSVILFSSLAVSQAQAQRKGALQALDEYTQNNAIQIYESIKMHTDDKQTLESDPYVSILSEAQNLEVEDYGLVSLSADGNCRYIVSDLEVSFTVEYTTQIHASYVLKIPVTLLGNEVWLDIPITISTRLNPKFDTQEETLQAYATGYVGEYDGNPHGITVTAEPADATILYGLTSDSQTLIESPTFTDVGAYIIFYRVEKEGYSPITGSAAVIIVEPPTPFAVLSADGSLVFYYRREIPQAGDTFDGKTVTAVYTGFSTATYTSASSVPWYSDRASITSVSFASEFAAVQPVSTAFWFYYCSNLTTFNQANLDTSSTISMGYMFMGCSGLTSLDLSGFDTSRVTNMVHMFFGCTKLTVLDLSSFDTSNVTVMAGMFAGCSSLTSLDLSRFDTGNVVNMFSMLKDCSSLETIYASDLWSTDAVTSSGSMFTGCSKLVGAISYDSSMLDATYANYTTGYFTYKAAS